MMPRIAMMRALRRREPGAAQMSRRKRAKRYTVIK
jgi:hypothetical protein